MRFSLYFQTHINWADPSDERVSPITLRCAEITCMLERASGQVTSVYITIIRLSTWPDAEARPGLIPAHTFFTHCPFMTPHDEPARQTRSVAHLAM